MLTYIVKRIFVGISYITVIRMMNRIGFTALFCRTPPYCSKEFEIKHRLLANLMVAEEVLNPDTQTVGNATKLNTTQSAIFPVFPGSDEVFFPLPSQEL